jgi:hypothetical protein
VAKPPEPTTVGAFAQLPIDQTKVIDLAINETRKNVLSPAQVEQELRDAIFIAVLAMAGPNKAELNVTFVRNPKNPTEVESPRSLITSGQVRSCCLEGDQLLLLAPHSATLEHRIHVADAADHFFWHCRKRPSVVHLVEYKLSTEQSHGTITRRAPLEKEAVYAKSYGYCEQTITKGETELRAFLNLVDDVVCVKQNRNGDSLILGGRRLPGRKPVGLSPQQTIEIWKVVQKANNRWGKVTQKWHDENEQLRRECQRQQAELAFKWERVGKTLIDLDRPESEVDRLEMQAKQEAGELEYQINEKAQRLNNRQTKELQAVEQEIEQIWHSIPEDVMKAWQRVTIKSSGE